MCNITTAAKESRTSALELLELLAYETKAPAWPNVLANSSTKVNRALVQSVDIEKRSAISVEEDIKGMLVT